MTKIRTLAEIRATSGASGFRFDLALIVLCGILAISIALMMGQSQSSNGAAISRVLIEKSDVNIQAELEALRAPELAAAVIADLHLGTARDFAAAKNTSEHLTDLWEGVLQRAGIIHSVAQAAEISPAEALQRWRDVVNVAIEPHTRVLKVSVALNNSALAVQIADALARKFADQEVDEYRPVASLDQLRREVDQAQAQLEAAQSVNPDAGLVDLPQSYDQLQAKAGKIRELVARGQIFDAVDVFDQPALRALADERRQIKTEIQVQSRTLLDQHPTMIELRGRLTRVEAEIRGATPKAVAALESDLAHARARMQAEQARSPVPAEPLSALEQRVQNARRRLNDQLLKVASGQAIAESVAAKKYRIFVPAEKPQMPLWGESLAHLAYVGFYGGGLGLGLVFLRRALRRRPAELQLPVTVSATLKPEPEAQIIEPERPGRAFFPAPDDPFAYGLSDALERCAGPQIVLVHGFVEDDIRPALIEFACEKSLVLVDLGPPSRLERGLGDLLAGSASFEDVIRSAPGETFDRLRAGRPRLGRLGLDLVIATLNESYDLVVLTALDITSADFEEIAPLVTLAALAERQGREEENIFIEQVLADFECHETLILPPLAPHALKEAA